MGLAKLIVPIQGLVDLVLEEDENKTVRLGNTEHWPETSRIIDVAVVHRIESFPSSTLVITLSDPTLPEPGGSGPITEDDFVESFIQVETLETTPDQQLRLDRYENELRNVLFLSSISGTLPLDVFSKKLAILTTRILSVIRHEDPDLVLQIEGKSEEQIEASNDKLE